MKTDERTFPAIPIGGKFRMSGLTAIFMRIQRAPLVSFDDPNVVVLEQGNGLLGVGSTFFFDPPNGVKFDYILPEEDVKLLPNTSHGASPEEPVAKQPVPASTADLDMADKHGYHFPPD